MSEKREERGEAASRRRMAAPKDRAWFERKVAELKAGLDKLSADRHEQRTAQGANHDA